MAYTTTFAASPVYVDTNVVIEAVRVGCWNAITGSLCVHTAASCRDEMLAGDSSQIGYVEVSNSDASRMTGVHAVTEAQRAAFLLAYPGSGGMDEGERDLFSLALDLHASTTTTFWICSADKSCVRAAVGLGWHDRLCSLQALSDSVGARPRVPLFTQFREAWLTTTRTEYLLDRGV
jgi:hypothetical protein